MGIDEFNTLIDKTIAEFKSEYPAADILVEKNGNQIKVTMTGDARGGRMISRMFDSSIMTMVRPKGYLDYSLHKMYGSLFF